MSTATATATVNKDHLKTFCRLNRDGFATIIGVNGMILLRRFVSKLSVERSFCICIGDYDGDPVEFPVDDAAVMRYVRQVKAADDISCRIVRGDNLSLVLDSSKLGEMSFDCTNEEIEEPFNVFDNLGEFKATINLDDVLAAGTIIDRTDQEQCRFSLGNVQFDDGCMIATDGRRLVSLASSVRYEGVLPVPASVIEYAARFKYEIDVFGSYCIAGDSIISNIEGRFPNWRQVFPTTDNKVTKAGDELRKVADGHLARMKTAGEKEKTGVDFQLHDDKVAKLDARFMLAAIGKLKSIDISYPDRFDSSNTKYLTGPVLLTSDERPGWREVIMPMAYDR